MRWHDQRGDQGQHVQNLLLLSVAIGVDFVPQGVADSHDATDLFQKGVEMIFDVFQVSCHIWIDGLVFDDVLQDLHHGTNFALQPI
eukprot:Skav232400  [mRNA]  locus=scaffold1077:631554:634316:+ [translate_table: standard]